MALIINKSFPMFKVGYPTVSDKYDVEGGILTGTESVEFGELVCRSGTTGYYEKFSTAKKTDVAGFVLATNVKLAAEWGKDAVKVEPGEAFNLLLDGYIAIKLAANAVESNIKPGSKVAVTDANGSLTTSGVESTTDLTNCTFTGVYEKQGAQIVAEIRVK